MIWRGLYAGLTYLLLLPVFGYFAWRGRIEPDYRRHWSERLGYIDVAAGRTLWIHAASVGEVILVTPVLEALMARYPEANILLTTFTPTGRAEARRRLGDRIQLRYLPLDTPGATRRFLRRAAPVVGIVAETELWPNLLASADRAGVPMVLINASLSDRSAARYRRWPASRAARFMLTRFARIAAAGPVHAERLIAAGATEETVEVAGNLKYDRKTDSESRQAAEALRQQWRASERPVWLTASTHATEESQLMEAFEILKARHPSLLWVIAPRHPQHFDEVAALLQRTSWRYVRRSQGEGVDDRTDIVLADTLGELDMFYALADVAFVGGSLAPGTGGHNVIEPAAAGCVFTTGPYADDWREAMAPMIDTNGAAIAADVWGVADKTEAWLRDDAGRRASGQRLVAVADAHCGALRRVLDILEDVMAP
ncbi:3-deoxy-D-manno-octulosonic acid transferase [Salinisphaera hydrothermalis]|uniref:3-deoxy-D-manno-octulosonic acid transferase n=1 Tax=Salinisphaera hydrothermalis TaxID=563188 RepID=UPI00333FA0EB